MWKMPEDVVQARADNDLPTISKEKALDPATEKNENKSQKS
jgi:hypothetical protein